MKGLSLLQWFAALVLLLWMGLALLGPVLPLDPNTIQLQRILLAPGGEALLGADDLGRGVFERIVVGAQTSFLVAVWVVLISALVGTGIGTVAAWYGGWVDLVLTRVFDLFLAFPGILLAIALAGVLGPGVENVVIALSVMGWVGFARLSRAQVMSIRHREHVQAAIALGTPVYRIMQRHLLPLMMAPLIVEATFAIAGVVVAEAGLSFLGLGVQPPEPSWGSLIRDGADYLLVAPHLLLGPAACLALVVLSVNLLGDAVRDGLDVKRT